MSRFEKIIWGIAFAVVIMTVIGGIVWECAKRLSVPPMEYPKEPIVAWPYCPEYPNPPAKYGAPMTPEGHQKLVDQFKKQLKSYYAYRELHPNEDEPARLVDFTDPDYAPTCLGCAVVPNPIGEIYTLMDLFSAYGISDTALAMWTSREQFLFYLWFSHKYIPGHREYLRKKLSRMADVLCISLYGPIGMEAYPFYTMRQF